MRTAETKQCIGCRESKAANEFYKQPNSADGRKGRCKTCCKEQQREYQRARKNSLGAVHDEAFYVCALADPAHTKHCYVCGETKHVGGFPKHKHRHDGFNSRCTSCENDRHATQARKTSRRARTLGQYGMNDTQYQMLLDSQGGVCAICGNSPQVTEKLAVDHCHKGGHVRGLLCRPCNAAIGLLKDDAQIANRAVQYLLKV